MINELIKRYPALAECKIDIENAVDKIAKTYETGGKLLLCGNGGSCADCEHISGELMKGFLKKRPLSEDKKREMIPLCLKACRMRSPQFRSPHSARSIPRFVMT